MAIIHIVYDPDDLVSPIPVKALKELRLSQTSMRLEGPLTTTSATDVIEKLLVILFKQILAAAEEEANG